MLPAPWGCPQGERGRLEPVGQAQPGVGPAGPGPDPLPLLHPRALPGVPSRPGARGPGCPEVAWLAGGVMAASPHHSWSGRAPRPGPTCLSLLTSVVAVGWSTLRSRKLPEALHQLLLNSICFLCDEAHVLGPRGCVGPGEPHWEAGVLCAGPRSETGTAVWTQGSPLESAGRTWSG